MRPKLYCIYVVCTFWIGRITLQPVCCQAKNQIMLNIHCNRTISWQHSIYILGTFEVLWSRLNNNYIVFEDQNKVSYCDNSVAFSNILYVLPACSNGFNGNHMMCITARHIKHVCAWCERVAKDELPREKICIQFIIFHNYFPIPTHIFCHFSWWFLMSVALSVSFNRIFCAACVCRVLDTRRILCPWLNFFFSLFISSHILSFFDYTHIECRFLPLNALPMYGFWVNSLCQTES